MTNPIERPDPQDPVNDRVEAIASEGEQVTCDLLYSEKSHFAAAERLQNSHRTAGVAATLMSAAAAATVFADLPVLTGVLALGAALASGLLTFLKPDEQAANHLAVGRELGSLRVELRHLLHLDLAHQPAEVSSTTLEDITARKADIERSAPSTTERDFESARTKIERGDFEA